MINSSNESQNIENSKTEIEHNGLWLDMEPYLSYLQRENLHFLFHDYWLPENPLWRRPNSTRFLRSTNRRTNWKYIKNRSSQRLFQGVSPLPSFQQLC